MKKEKQEIKSLLKKNENKTLRVCTADSTSNSLTPWGQKQCENKVEI